jgi:hypothetical protein
MTRSKTRLKRRNKIITNDIYSNITFSKAFVRTGRMEIGQWLDFSVRKLSFGIGTTLEFFQTRENVKEVRIHG